jgi:hypothetical protein
MAWFGYRLEDSFLQTGDRKNPAYRFSSRLLFKARSQYPTHQSGRLRGRPLAAALFDGPAIAAPVPFKFQARYSGINPCFIGSDSKRNVFRGRGHFSARQEERRSFHISTPKTPAVGKQTLTFGACRGGFHSNQVFIRIAQQVS